MSALASISWIIPLFADGARGGLVCARLREVLELLAATGSEIVVGDASVARALTVEHICARHGARRVACPQPGSFAPGLARNAAVQHATRPYVLLFDVDLWFAPEFLQRLPPRLAWLARNPLAFVMAPCLYLTPAATKAVEADAACIEAFWQDYLRGNFAHSVNLAVVSSALLLHRAAYLASGGHCAAFSGHGGEDLEYINRLTGEWPLGARDTDHPVDARQESIAASRGFRRYFSYYGLPVGLGGLVLAHRRHPRPPTRYFRRHARNARLLQDYMARYHTRGDAPDALPDLGTPGLAAVIPGPEVADVQAFRHFLPPLGRYRVLRTPEALAQEAFTHCFFLGMDAQARAQWLHRTGFTGGYGFLEAAGEGRWRCVLQDAQGAILCDELHTGLRHVYADGRSYRWVFHRGEDARADVLLYHFTPPDYANLPPPPPLPEHITQLLRETGRTREEYPGLFLNQWSGEGAGTRAARKCRKLLLNPRAFFRDSARRRV